MWRLYDEHLVCGGLCHTVVLALYIKWIFRLFGANVVSLLEYAATLWWVCGGPCLWRECGLSLRICANSMMSMSRPLPHSCVDILKRMFWLFGENVVSLWEDLEVVATQLCWRFKKYDVALSRECGSSLRICGGSLKRMWSLLPHSFLCWCFKRMMWLFEENVVSFWADVVALWRGCGAFCHTDLCVLNKGWCGSLEGMWWLFEKMWQLYDEYVEASATRFFCALKRMFWLFVENVVALWADVVALWRGCGGFCHTVVLVL